MGVSKWTVTVLVATTGPLSRMVGSAIIWVLTVLAVVGGSEARDCNQEVQAYQNMISAFLGPGGLFADVIQTSIGRQNEDGNSLLSIAAENGLADVVDHILAFNGSVNNVNKANLTAAHLAESNCFLDIAKKINLREVMECSNGVINFNGDQLCRDVAGGKEFLVVEMLHCARSRQGNGASMLVTNNKFCRPARREPPYHRLKQSTALMEAVIDQRSPMVRIILDQIKDQPYHGFLDARENKYGMTALMMAAYSGNEGITRMLLEAGADPNITEYENKTALNFALKAENEGSGREAAEETAITLLEFKANYPSYLDRSLNKLLAPDTVDSVLLKERPRVLSNADDGPVFDAQRFCSSAAQGDAVYVKKMLKCGNGIEMLKADPFCRPASHKPPYNRLKQSTALMEAVINQGSSMVRIILDQIKDHSCQGFLDARENKYGMTALMMAAYSGNEGITRMLLEAGADPNITEYENKTALMFALKAENGREAAKETVKTLLEFEPNYPSVLDGVLNQLLAPDTVDSVLLKIRQEADA